MEINMHLDNNNFYTLETDRIGPSRGTVCGPIAHNFMFQFLRDKSTVLNMYRILKNNGFRLKLNYKF